MAPRRKEPGILRLLPETLPFYPYRQTNGNKPLRLSLNVRKREDLDVENMQSNAANVSRVIQNAPLQRACNENENAIGKGTGFTLFFFVDYTNRQSLLAVPLVRQWFHYALNDGGEDISVENRVICIPNHPLPNEISSGNSASINSSTSSVAKQNVLSMLLKTGFYHLPFVHPIRLPLLHILGATRVPCVIVVGNDNGRIVTRLGWEAIERENGSRFGAWMKSNLIENKNSDGDKLDDKGKEEEGCTIRFESEVKAEWSNGRSGLPTWRDWLSWLI